MKSKSDAVSPDKWHPSHQPGICMRRLQFLHCWLSLDDQKKGQKNSPFFICTDDLSIFDTQLELATDTGLNFGAAFKHTDFFLST